MENSENNIINSLSQEFNLQKYQAENTIELIDSGNTIPFIARYRKEKTGSLSDEVLRDFLQDLHIFVILMKKKKILFI